MNQITHFHEIPLFSILKTNPVIKGTVYLDIDDTLISFGDVTKKYFATTKTEDDPLYYGWANLIKDLVPTLVDEKIHDFLQLVKSLNFNIEFITARNPLFKEMTLKHLKHHNLDEYKIHFLGPKSKGLHVKEIKNKEDIIIFIDDSVSNCKSVLKENPEVNVFNIKEKIIETT